MFRLQFDEFQIVSSSHDDTILIWDFLNVPIPEGSTRSPSRTYTYVPKWWPISTSCCYCCRLPPPPYPNWRTPLLNYDAPPPINGERIKKKKQKNFWCWHACWMHGTTTLFSSSQEVKKKKKLLWFAHVMHSVLYKKKTKKNRQYKITRQLTWQKLLKTGKRKKFCDETWC